MKKFFLMMFLLSLFQVGAYGAFSITYTNDVHMSNNATLWIEDQPLTRNQMLNLISSLQQADILAGSNIIITIVGRSIRISSSGGGGSGNGNMMASNNLSELTSKSTARINLGLGSASTSDTSDFATKDQGSLATTALQPANNLSELTSRSTARSNLGLGSASVNNTSDFATYAQGLLAATALQLASIVAGSNVTITASNGYLVISSTGGGGGGESLSTNRLVWMIGSTQVGYVSTNGITLLIGSLQLYEQDLNCNVRAYDGSAASPSMTFQTDNGQGIGWHRRSWNGTSAWAWSYASQDVYVVSSGGVWTVNGNVYHGDGSQLTGTEPLFMIFTTNPVLAASFKVYDPASNLVFAVDRYTGATTIRSQDSDVRYLVSTNGYTGTNVWYSTNSNGVGVVTNTDVWIGGQLRSKTP